MVRLRLLVAPVLLALVLAGAGCSGGDDNVADDVGSVGGTSSSAAPGGSADTRDAKTQLLVATTGINLVATEINIRTFSSTAAAYCDKEAKPDLAPHRAKLEAAADAGVRDKAKEALARLDAAVKVCAEGADRDAVQQALQHYRESFDPLLQAVEAMPAG